MKHVRFCALFYVLHYVELYSINSPIKVIFDTNELTETTCLVTSILNPYIVLPK